jgi:serralysin
VAGQFGGWGFIGAEATAGGYEVALKLAGAQEYALWNTDSNGNYLSGGTIVAATDPTLESAEITLHQDLNGDGTIGIPGRTVIESFGSTYLTEVGNNFYLDNGSGVGPSLKLSGANVVAGQFGGWEFIGAEATAGGYEVALKLPGAWQFALWNTDSNGNYLSGGTILAGTSPTLEAAEVTLHQDLNGDGIIGIPGTGGNASTAISMVAAPVVAASAAPATPASNGTVVSGSQGPAPSESLVGGDGHLVASVQNPSPALPHDFHLV